jgi:hypothetical protein
LYFSLLLSESVLDSTLIHICVTTVFTLLFFIGQYLLIIKLLFHKAFFFFNVHKIFHSKFIEKKKKKKKLLTFRKTKIPIEDYFFFFFNKDTVVFHHSVDFWQHEHRNLFISASGIKIPSESNAIFRIFKSWAFKVIRDRHNSVLSTIKIPYLSQLLKKITIKKIKITPIIIMIMIMIIIKL